MILRLLLAYALAFLPMQGLGGKAGIGGKAGFGGGPVAGGTTVIFNTTQASGNASATTLSLGFTGVGLTTGNYVGLIIGFQGITATVNTVCDGGSGGTQCPSASTYTNNSQAVIRNTTNSAQYWFTCNYQGTVANGITVTLTGSATYLYVALVTATGNRTSGCDDGYAANSGASGAAYSSGATGTTTNAHDMFVGFFMNDSGGTYTAGTDGQGNTMTIQANDAGVVAASTFNEAATNPFTASITGPNTHWEAIGAAVK